jgi:hypothetical protein
MEQKREAKMLVLEEDRLRFGMFRNLEKASTPRMKRNGDNGSP